MPTSDQESRAPRPEPHNAQRFRKLLEERRRLDIEAARLEAAELIASINAAGGPFAHKACNCCGCRAAARWLNQQRSVA
jgi:hypothetical protein